MVKSLVLVTADLALPLIASRVWYRHYRPVPVTAERPALAPAKNRMSSCYLV